MRSRASVFLAVLGLAAACEHTPERQVEKEPVSLADANPTLRRITRLVPEILQRSESDTQQVLYREGTADYGRDFWSDSTDVLVGRLFGKDPRSLFAVISSTQDSAGQITAYTEFYELASDKHWKNIGRFRTGGRDLRLVDLSGDGCSEVVFTENPGMVSTLGVFTLPRKDTVVFAGTFPDGAMSYNEHDNVLEVVPVSSSPFDGRLRQVYRWLNHKLILWKQARLVVRDESPRHYYLIAYAERPAAGKDSLQTVFEERYDPKNAKHRRYWNDLLFMLRSQQEDPLE